MLDLVAEADSRGIAVEQGFGNTQQLLAGMLQLSAAEARTRVKRAAAVGTRHAITGETLAPQLPVTAAALAARAISTGPASGDHRDHDGVRPATRDLRDASRAALD